MIGAVTVPTWLVLSLLWLNLASATTAVVVNGRLAVRHNDARRPLRLTRVGFAAAYCIVYLFRLFADVGPLRADIGGVMSLALGPPAWWAVWIVATVAYTPPPTISQAFAILDDDEAR